MVFIIGRLLIIDIRFNAGAQLMGANGDEDFVKAVDLEDWRKMAQVEVSTIQYLEEDDTVKQLDRCAQRLARIARKYK
jgi:thiamine monophosphate synthase